MADFKDTVGDLVKHAYDSITGKLSAPSAPDKPASSETPVTGDWLNRAKASSQNDRNSTIDKQISDNE